MYRRIDIAEVPLISGNLATGMQIEVIQDQLKLLLGKIEVHHRQWYAVEGEVPNRIPGIFPLVRHGNDIVIDHMEPALVPNRAARRAERVNPMLLQPLIRIEVEVLLGPEHSCQSLTQYVRCVLSERLGRKITVERICFL